MQTKLTPSQVELTIFFSEKEAIDEVCLDLINEGYFNQKFWNTIRTHVHSLDNNNQIGRRLSAFVGFYNCGREYRLLGILMEVRNTPLKQEIRILDGLIKKGKKGLSQNCQYVVQSNPLALVFLVKFGHFADSLIPL